MRPDKDAVDLVLSGKYLAWDSSPLNDVFTTRDRTIPVVQLRRLYYSDGTEALMVGYYKDLGCETLLKREVFHDGDISEEELVHHIDEQFYDGLWDITPEYYEFQKDYTLSYPGGHIRLEDRSDYNVRRRFGVSAMEYIPPYISERTGEKISCRTIFTLEIPTDELTRNHVYDIYHVAHREKPEVRELTNKKHNAALFVMHYKNWSAGLAAYGLRRKKTSLAAYYRVYKPWDVNGYRFVYLSDGLSVIPFRAGWVSNKGQNIDDCEAALAYWLM